MYNVIRNWFNSQHPGDTNQPHIPAPVIPADVSRSVNGSSKPLHLLWQHQGSGSIPFEICLSSWSGAYDMRVLVVTDHNHYWIDVLRTIPAMHQDEVLDFREEDNKDVILQVQLRLDSRIRAIVPVILLAEEPRYDGHWHKPEMSLVAGHGRRKQVHRDARGVVSFMEDIFHPKSEHAKAMVPWALRYDKDKQKLTLHPLELYGGYDDIIDDTPDATGNLLVLPPHFDHKGRVQMDQPFAASFNLGWRPKLLNNSSTGTSTTK